MLQKKAKLISNLNLKGPYWRCVLDAKEIACNAHPGQFVNVKVCDSSQVLLRRPLGIHRTKGSSIELLYEVVGKGTKLLSQKEKGGYLDIIGPLGHGFDYKPSSPVCAGAAVLVAGGMGIAPLVFLAERLSKTAIKPLVVTGAKTKDHILCEKEFKNLGFAVKIATDDGSKGFRGKVTDLLKRLLRTNDQRLTTIYACGPSPMLKEIGRLSKQYGFRAQVSLEEHMACGIGACLGCAVQTIEGYRRVCKDGPVFEASEIIW